MSTLPIRVADVQPATITASLTLAIGPTQYAVAPVPGIDPTTARRAFWLTKLPLDRKAAREVYTVRQMPAGWQDCTCPDAIFRRRQCKHLRALEALGLIDAEPRNRRAAVAAAPPCEDEAPWYGAECAAEHEGAACPICGLPTGDAVGVAHSACQDRELAELDIDPLAESARWTVAEPPERTAGQRAPSYADDSEMPF